ncbi:phosphate/phosphite/phosphonate ABC transporter substrate-binding protein [Marinilactibacillus kalidii]|uniref:phosphate/phosphite/phosphonate ABC transporter substrate-binding protein n=1 Tax=Marinilactibacillus kalidii TaxID=2820274 RepID=UPI001FC98318|nr:PhnD/SsuA/transferrin family substrate-binding protein [Marinilactibacillus kalidii]
MSNKWLKGLGITFASTLVLAACGNGSDDSASPETNEDGNVAIEELSVQFVPSRDPEEIVAATKPLENILKDELAEQGFDVEQVKIDVGTDYEAVGEAMSAGSVDVGFLPGGTYVLYDDGADVILTSTRAGLTNDSEDPAEWNANKPTEPTDEQVTYYRSILVAGPSEKGRELADKVNNGEELTWEDLDSASWSVMSSSSSAGYIYPTIWMQENYDKSLSDLSQVSQADSYGTSVSRLATEQADVAVMYADARRDYTEDWEGTFGGEDTIWDSTDVIGVTPGIYNDTISVSKNSDIMTDDLKAALQESFINIAGTDEGKEIIAIYSHEGYEKSESSDYDVEREAQEILRNLTN